MTDYKPIAESNNFIVLDRYTREWTVSETGASYQTESDLEQEFMPDIKSPRVHACKCSGSSKY